MLLRGLFEGDAGAAFTLPAFGEAPGIFAATALVFFVHIGFEDVADPSEEAKDPRCDTPRALLQRVGITSRLDRRSLVGRP